MPLRPGAPHYGRMNRSVAFWFAAFVEMIGMGNGDLTGAVATWSAEDEPDAEPGAGTESEPDADLERSDVTGELRHP